MASQTETQIKIRRLKDKHRKKPLTTTRILIVSSAFIHNYTTNSCTKQNNTVRTSQDDFRSSLAKTAEDSQRNTTLLFQLCPYMHFTNIPRTCITHSASLACLETKKAAIHEHTHCTTTERDNRLMRPKTDGTNDPTKVTNTIKNTEDTNIYYSYAQQAHMYHCMANLNIGFCCYSVGP